MANIIAEVAGVQSKPIKISRPKWEDVYNSYPKRNTGQPDEDDQYADTLFKEIFGEDYDKNTFSNACATRVSIALLGAGMKVKGEFSIRYGQHKGKGITVSAINLLNWLSKENVFGKADVIISAPLHFSDVYSKLKDYKGIYILESNNYNWATGHATLWYNGNAIGKHHYCERAKAIHFWELK